MSLNSQTRTILKELIHRENLNQISIDSFHTISILYRLIMNILSTKQYRISRTKETYIKLSFTRL